jgi:hypothetical protein
MENSITCNKVFAIKRLGLPSDWYDDNKDFVCDADTTPEHYYVDNDLIADISIRMRWNCNNEKYIDFDKSAQYIIKRHDPKTDAPDFDYIDLQQSDVSDAIKSGFENTYTYFVQFKNDGGKLAVVEAVSYLNEQNIFSLPFIIAIFTENTGKALGVNLDIDGSVNLRINSQYYNISNDPTK